MKEKKFAIFIVLKTMLLKLKLPLLLKNIVNYVIIQKYHFILNRVVHVSG